MPAADEECVNQFPDRVPEEFVVLGAWTGTHDSTSHAVGRGAGGSGGRADFSASCRFYT